MLAVPVDPEDTPELLNEWMEELDPPYELLTPDADDQVAIQRLVAEHLYRDGIPANIITDGRGNVLEVLWGAPSVSGIRRLLQDADGIPRFRDELMHPTLTEISSRVAAGRLVSPDSVEFQEAFEIYRAYADVPRRGGSG